MSEPGPRRRVSALAVVCLAIEAALLVLFVPGLVFVEVLQNDGDGGVGNAIGLAVTLLLVAVIVVAASIVAFVRDRRAGLPVGLSIGSIALGVVLVFCHAGFTLPGALT